MLVPSTLFLMNTEFAFETVTVRVTGFPAAIVCTLAVMLTVVAVGAGDVVCEPPVCPLEEDEPIPLPHAERNNNVRNATHRVKYPERPDRERLHHDTFLSNSTAFSLVFLFCRLQG